MGGYICTLYDSIVLDTAFVKDEFDAGVTQTCLKCEDCQEKELSTSIDNKIDEIKDLYNVFVYEMDLLMDELEVLKIKRRGIYE